MITPKLPLLKGLPFVVQVSHYTAHPSEPNPDELLSTAFFITPGRLGDGRPARRHARVPAVQRPPA